MLVVGIFVGLALSAVVIFLVCLLGQIILKALGNDNPFSFPIWMAAFMCGLLPALVIGVGGAVHLGALIAGAT